MQDITVEKTDRLRQLMNTAVRDCLVSGYEPLIAAWTSPTLTTVMSWPPRSRRRPRSSSPRICGTSGGATGSLGSQGEVPGQLRPRPDKHPTATLILDGCRDRPPSFRSTKISGRRRFPPGGCQKPLPRLAVTECYWLCPTRQAPSPRLPADSVRDVSRPECCAQAARTASSGRLCSPGGRRASGLEPRRLSIANAPFEKPEGVANWVNREKVRARPAAARGPDRRAQMRQDNERSRAVPRPPATLMTNRLFRSLRKYVILATGP